MKTFFIPTVPGHGIMFLDERRILANVPNALAYHRILETVSNGYVVRQFIHSSLYDRMR
jgi:phosphoinositide-3-kinase, regulatory subunit 4